MRSIERRTDQEAISQQVVREEHKSGGNGERPGPNGERVSSRSWRNRAINTRGFTIIDIGKGFSVEGHSSEYGSKREHGHSVGDKSPLDALQPAVDGVKERDYALEEEYDKSTCSRTCEVSAVACVREMPYTYRRGLRRRAFRQSQSSPRRTENTGSLGRWDYWTRTVPESQTWFRCIRGGEGDFSAEWETERGVWNEPRRELDSKDRESRFVIDRRWVVNTKPAVRVPVRSI